MKTKKKIVIVAVIIAVVMATFGGFYVFSGLERVEVQTHRYLMEQGYTNADINTINVNFSPFNWSLSYNGWTSTVVFADEPSVEYHFILAYGKICGNGFSSESSLPEKQFGLKQSIDNVDSKNVEKN